MCESERCLLWPLLFFVVPQFDEWQIHAVVAHSPHVTQCDVKGFRRKITVSTSRLSCPRSFKIL